MSTGGSPIIPRPRPLSSLNRPVRRSTGSAPEEIQRSLKDAVRKISTVSMPVISMEGGSPLVVGTAAGPTAAAAAQASPVLPGKHQAGVSPELNPSVLSPTPATSTRSVPTTPLSPLSPVFSAVSAEPLQPQTANSPKLPVREVSASPTAPSTPNLADFGSEFGDKYAALADLDSAFSSDPAKASSTAINWGASDTTEEECEEAESVNSPSQGLERAGGGVSSAETRQVPYSPTPTPTPTPSQAATRDNPFRQSPTPHIPPQSQVSDAFADMAAAGGDKYAALADFNAATTLPSAVNWGPSPSAEEEGSSPATESPTEGVVLVPGGHPPMQDMSRGGSVLAGVAGLGSAPGVISSSPPTRSAMMAPQAQMYGPSTQPVVYGPQVNINNMGYCPPSTMYHGPPTPHPGFAPPPAGFIYPQYPPQHAGSQPGYPGVPATYPGAAPPVVGFTTVASQGAGWVQPGNVAVPSTTYSPAHPVMGSGQVPPLHVQTPVCMS